MAEREFVFRVNKPNPPSVKDTVLQQYDHYVWLQEHDDTVKHLQQSRRQISQEITQSFATLQQTTDHPTIKSLHERLNHLTDLSKKIEIEYEQCLRQHLPLLNEHWPAILDRIKEGLDRETLSDVLTTFEHLQKGMIDEKQAVEHGMDYMTHKFNLPKDFFDHNAINRFNQIQKDQFK